MRKIGLRTGLSVALAVTAVAGGQPALAQAEDFNAFFEKKNSGTAASERPDHHSRDQRRNIRRPSNPDFNGPVYRRHVGDLAANGGLSKLEQRGYDARRARPGHQIGDEFDLTPNERRDLQQRGRQAQITRGRRNGFRPVIEETAAGSRNHSTHAQYRYDGYTGAGREPVRGQGARLMRRANRSKGTAKSGYAATSLQNRISAVDMGAEAFGGHNAGIGEYGVAMTVGQAQVFANGDDPVVAAAGATERFGHNLYGAAHGVGQSIRDPRRIPGNVNRAAAGVAQTGTNAVRYVGETVIKSSQDGARFVSDPQYASTQVKKTVGNIGKSTCKGVSTLLGLNKRKCR
ncbi:MAG: hypothetical protein ABJP62_03715 [Parasphingorhabdus sp.]|uniref:hypothetical protein n=2 Tax=Parasphingorhabdus sp. TaxID=2709688 RepID=UPI003274AD1E